MKVRTHTLQDVHTYASRYLVDGVAGAAKFNPALGFPLYLQRGEGAHILDVEGREYIDYNTSFGATFLGHNSPIVRQAIEKALDLGVIAGLDNPYSGELGQILTEVIPCAERVRFANTGSESTMVAIRIARAYTEKSKLLKFEGHFHGLHDYVMYNAHGPVRPVTPGEYVTPLRESGGIPDQIDELVTVVAWNDTEAFERAMREQGDEIAAVICEPINYNSGCIPPDPAFIKRVRELTEQRNVVLIFDEVLSGFRTGVDCAQGYLGVTPDLCTLAKAVANGIPFAVVAGKVPFMKVLSRDGGSVTQSGTYSGHLFPVLASTACLKEMRRADFYDHIYELAHALYSGLREIFQRHGIKAQVQGIGARFGIFFGIDHEVRNYQAGAGFDVEQTSRFIRGCFERGVYFHSYDVAIGHHGFTAAHTLADIHRTLEVVEDVAKRGLL